MRRLFVLMIILQLLCFGCSSSERTVWSGPPSSEAEEAYRKAVVEKEDGNYDEAMRLFNQLKLKYPYATKWASLAELGVADVYFLDGHESIAASAYEDFVKSFPTHPEVSYAMFQVGECYYKLMPSDNFIFPPSWQRELKTSRQAELAYSSFIYRYPEDSRVEVAKKRVEEIQDRLARHELYLGEYYFKQEAYLGSVNRLKGLVERYSSSSLVPKALVLMAHGYLKLNDPLEAKSCLERVVRDYGESEYAVEARRWLARHTWVVADEG